MGLLKFIQPTALKFEKRKKIIGNAYSFTFKAEKPLTWHAGQHGMLEIKLPSGKTARRMFSLSSAPQENQVTITTYWHGDKASDYKKALWNLQPGDSTRIRGPVGPMYARDISANNILIAGGIGITPFRSMLIDADLSGEDIHATLLYANKSPDEVIFKDEFENLSKRLNNLEVKYIYSPTKISKDIINDSIGASKLENTNFYLSGPPEMIKTYKKLLKDIGISRKNIYSDPFMGYK